MHVSSYDESELLWAHSHICAEHLDHIVASCSLFYNNLLGVIDVIQHHQLLFGTIM